MESSQIRKKGVFASVAMTVTLNLQAGKNKGKSWKELENTIGVLVKSKE